MPKSRDIIASRVWVVVAARDMPVRDMRDCGWVAARDVVDLFVAVRAVVARVAVAVRDMVDAGRDMIFLFVAVRDDTVVFDCVRDRIVWAPRVDMFWVVRADVFCDRVAFFATAATAPSQIGTAKNTAKNRFRALISFL